MNKRFVLFFTLLIIAGQYFCPIRGFGYKGRVHTKITSNAIEKKATLFKKRLREIGFAEGYKTELKGNRSTKYIWKWITNGSVWEDYVLINYFLPDLYRGPFNGHFYNPLNKTGLLDKNGDIIGQSLIERANETSINEWSYPVAKQFFYIALTGDTTSLKGRPDEPLQYPDGYGQTYIRDSYWWISDIFQYKKVENLNEMARNKFFAWALQGLGHNLHLIQDASVPAHTRNDPHGLWEPYESYTTEHKDTLPYTSDGSDSWHYWKQYGVAFPQGAIAPTSGLAGNGSHAFIDLNTPVLPSETLQQGLAQYSHANFLSEDSLFTFDYPARPSWWQTVKPDFNDPRVFFDYGPNQNVKYYYLKSDKSDGAEYMALFGILIYLNWTQEASTDFLLMYTVDDPKVNADYAQKLIPRAVGYSAGLLDYFLRGKIEITLPETPIYINPVKLGVNRLKLDVQNITPGENMSEGKLVLSVKYRMNEEEPFEYITKEIDTACSLAADETAAYDIDLNGLEIPIDAQKIYFYLVYRGRLGNEADGIAVGMIEDPLPKLVHNPVITLPESGVYALADTVPDNPAIHGFDRIAFSVSDSSGESVVPDDGLVTAVLWYRVSQGDPFQALPPERFPQPSDDYHHIIKEFTGISNLNGAAFEADLDGRQLPLWASDVFLYLVYRSGNEVFCVMKDTSEPTPVDFYNLTDKVCLYNTLYDLVNDDGTLDETAISDAVIAVDTGPLGNNNGFADEWHVYPDDMDNMLIRFSPYENPAYADYQCPECNTYQVPEKLGPGESFRLFILTDSQYAVNVAFQFTAIDPNDNIYIHNQWSRPSILGWQAVTNQDLSRLYDPYCWTDPLSYQIICSYNVRFVPGGYYDFQGDDIFNWVMVKYEDYPEDPGCSLWP